MPTEHQLKIIIRLAVQNAHNTHGKQAAGDSLSISQADATVIADAVYDALNEWGSVLSVEKNGK